MRTEKGPPALTGSSSSCSKYRPRSLRGTVAGAALGVKHGFLIMTVWGGYSSSPVYRFRNWGKATLTYLPGVNSCWMVGLEFASGAWFQGSDEDGSKLFRLLAVKGWWGLVFQDYRQVTFQIWSWEWLAEGREARGEEVVIQSASRVVTCIWLSQSESLKKREKCLYIEIAYRILGFSQPKATFIISHLPKIIFKDFEYQF